jgi:glycosyltransferase involved in cell wall biosynthesis
MKEFVTIVYANRNRDLERIKASFDSLKNQTKINFRVVFVDYGSEETLVKKLKLLCSNYEFVTPYFLEVPQLLWNKSKALNYGISKTQSPYIFIADVDLVFHPETLSLLNKLAVEDKFFLFNLGYLDKEESMKLTKVNNFEELKIANIGNVNGMILVPTKALLEVNGLDEFFHFYGSEDEDLFARLERAGYKRENNESPYYFHNWHKIFADSEDNTITRNPRIKNIMRINQRHFLRNRDLGIARPRRQSRLGKVIGKEQSDLLKNPTKTVRVYNILAHLVHFFGEELPSYSGEIVKVEFAEDPYFHTLKYKIKNFLGIESQPYCSLKEVNDMVLKEIVFNYRDANYSFEISGDLKSIIFCIKL